ncbi:uncharacterized protein, partial [Amphiura filiformis]|uniref:uncharacterized protein n=1 Tax=Amphiura filiformis TaxID=82378 RepID=UPI003B21000C
YLQIYNQQRKESGFTVLAMSSYTYVDMTENWLRSIETLHIYPNITIIATDLAAYNELTKFSDSLSLIQAPTPRKPGDRSYTHFRWKYVLDLLQRNQDVLVSDVDTVWLENPFPYFWNRHDIFISWNPVSKRCPGLIFLRSTQNTIQFVTEFINRLSKEDSDTKVLNFMIDNQVIPTLTYSILDPLRFISGWFYFNDDWRTRHANVSPVVIHANGINMTSKDADWHDAKVKHLKKYGLWFNGNAKLTWEAGTASFVVAK